MTMTNRLRSPWRKHFKYLLANMLRYLGIFWLERLFLSRSRALILAFHRVVEDGEIVPCLDPQMYVTSTVFRDLLVFLRRHYDVVGLGDLLARDKPEECLPKPACALTFDDGYMDNYTHAFPILAEAGVPATIFLTAGLIGTKRLLWNDAISVACAAASRNGQTKKRLIELLQGARLSVSSFSCLEKKPDRFSAESVIRRLKKWPHAKIERLLSQLARYVPLDGTEAERFRLLTWEQVREMTTKGISFGSHTLSHCILPVESEETVQMEIEESKALIQSRLGTPIDAIAYPNGDYNGETIRAARRAGFRTGLTLRKEHASARSDPMRLGRFVVNQEDIVSPGGNFAVSLFEYETSAVVLKIKCLLWKALRGGSEERA